MTKIRDPELHKLRHHRQAGPHDEGRRRPREVRRSTLVPMYCPRCHEVTIDDEKIGICCPFCEDDTLEAMEE